ncbi:MAG: esterase/lipase superfamily enzyme [Algoriphagus sp.]|jgi:esterase/lipase superfamily enzyme
MICHEVVERIRLITSLARVVMAGCSFGGYHAINFSFRHPAYASHCFYMFGAFDIRSFMDGYQHDYIFYNSPLEYLPGLHDYELRNFDMLLGTSNLDSCLDANLKIHETLKSKNINHWLDLR